MYLSYDYFTGAVFESEPGTPYNITSILGLASAFASKAADGTAKPVAVIARDTASYSEAVYHLFISALLGGGVNVVELGIMPAPAVSWICGDRGAQMGFFIRSTPGTGGRVKITVYGQDGCVPERDFLESVNAASAAPPTVNTDGNMGRNIPVTNEINRYMLHVTDASDNRLTGLKVALDCANGAVLSVVEQIFTKLGAQCFLTANKPNGFNAGEKVCAANASNLSDFVLKNLCDVGFSFDNAGLRCVATDETGDFADGSVIAAVIAHHMSQFGTLENNTALFSANTNFGVKKYLKQVGAKFSLFENSEGLQALIESTKSNLVSDSRGFLRVTDRDMLSDGLRTAVMLCSLMVLTGESFSELTRDIYFYRPFSVSIKVPAASLEKYKKDRVIASAVKDAEKELDGEGEILLKSSEKDSTISVLAYGSDYEHISELALEISKVIKDRYIK